ncbi:MAG: cyclic pyranopterin monophosphate synthase MoaC [Planctomycetes bacterium]|nr:cyclic pyranopterin monophosphate synthase MoaC [Planctomycetota bacterium]
MENFSHVDNNGKASMVDVGAKTPQKRIATAAGQIALSPKTIELIKQNQIKKGDVLTVAQIAGINSAKQTPHLIPLCHPLLLEKIDVHLTIEKDFVKAVAKVHCTGKTGVEMEALTAVSVALLTVYDMCKAVDKNMKITQIELLEKVKKDV